jgi:hypothetical protein
MNNHIALSCKINEWNYVTRVQYGFLLHRNYFLLINMLEKFIKFENLKIKKQKI